VRKPYEGVSPFPDRFAGRAGEDEQELIDTLGRRRRGVSLGEKARERRSGEIPAQASASGPGRGKPMGASSGWPAKHMLAARDSRKGQNPGTAAHRAGPCTSRVWVYR